MAMISLNPQDPAGTLVLESLGVEVQGYSITIIDAGTPLACGLQLAWCPSLGKGFVSTGDQFGIWIDGGSAQECAERALGVDEPLNPTLH